MQNLQNMYLVRTASALRTGVFPWSDLNADVRHEILQAVPRRYHRYFHGDGGFNWTDLPPGVGAHILRHLQYQRLVIQGSIWQDWPVRWQQGRWRNRPERLRLLRTLYNLTFERSGTRQEGIRFAPTDLAGLTVTLSRSLDTTPPVRNDLQQLPDNDGYGLAALCAQINRTTRWRNVHTIRLIRWPCPYSNNNNYDRYSFEFVSTDEHGNEVTSTLDTIDITTFKKDLLEDRFRQTYNSGIGLRLRRVTLATARRRRPIQDWRNDEDDEISRTDAVEWSI